MILKRILLSERRKWLQNVQRHLGGIPEKGKNYRQGKNQWCYQGLQIEGGIDYKVTWSSGT